MLVRAKLTVILIRGVGSSFEVVRLPFWRVSGRHFPRENFEKDPSKRPEMAIFFALEFRKLVYSTSTNAMQVLNVVMKKIFFVSLRMGQARNVEK